MTDKTKIVIMGAAGRDFHNFNTYFRDNENYEVMAFTATQIPDIEGRLYPPELAGPLYPEGITIRPEKELSELIKEEGIDQVIFAYSDVPYQYVMERASLVNASGADFRLMGTKSTQLSSRKPLISITAVRTGCGKSQTTRRVTDILRSKGRQVVVIRHPMPYGDLAKQIWQRYETIEDLDKYECTIEEREEYEPHIDRGNIVYAGVDYKEILKRAEQEADVIVWDGGNNDFSFYRADLNIVVADPLRAGHELTYYPGNISLRVADVVIINKVDTAEPDQVDEVRKNVKSVNPKAQVIEAASPVFVEDPGVIKDKRVLVIEDGPTLTHGGMEYGAGTIAAQKFNAKKIIDPHPYVVKSIAEVYKKYPHIGALLPAMGYSKQQVKDLEETIKKAQPDSVVIGTPIDLSRLIDFDVPTTRVSYELKETGKPDLEDILDKF